MKKYKKYKQWLQKRIEITQEIIDNEEDSKFKKNKEAKILAYKKCLLCFSIDIKNHFQWLQQRIKETKGVRKNQEKLFGARKRKVINQGIRLTVLYECYEYLKSH